MVAFFPLFPSGHCPLREMDCWIMMGPSLEELCCCYEALKVMVLPGWAGRLPLGDARIKPFLPCCNELPSRCFWEAHPLPTGTLTEEESHQEWSHLLQGDCLLLLTPEA